MFLVRFTTEDEAPLLKPCDKARRIRHVGPLVHLIGRKHPRGKRCEKHAGQVAPWRPQWNPESGGEHWHDEHRDVAVAVDEVSAEKVARVDVVDAKWAEKPPAEDRQRLAAPGIGAPVHEARQEIGGKAGRDDDERDPPRDVDGGDEPSAARRQQDGRGGQR